MLTLRRSQALRLTGTELLALLDQAGDRAVLAIDGLEWRIYTSTHRRRHETVHLWREIERLVTLPDGTPTGQRSTETIHIVGAMDLRIADMRRIG